MVSGLERFPPLPSGGESGSADTVRDPRGFAVKFYTEDGNWDLVGNNTPIFFVRDPLLVILILCIVEHVVVGACRFQDLFDLF